MPALKTKPHRGSVYDRVVKHIFFDGNLEPGTKIIEKELAEQLGIGRIPIRESLRRIAGQGLLVGEHDDPIIQLRRYTPEEIRQLYEAREFMEAGAARAAARAATNEDIAQMQRICQQTTSFNGAVDSQGWAELDYAFHAAVADSSHNDRVARSLKLMLTECRFLFFRLGAIPELMRKGVESIKERVLSDHYILLEMITVRNAEGAEQIAREHMRKSSVLMVQSLADLSLPD